MEGISLQSETPDRIRDMVAPVSTRMANGRKARNQAYLHTTPTADLIRTGQHASWNQLPIVLQLTWEWRWKTSRLVMGFFSLNEQRVLVVLLRKDFQTSRMSKSIQTWSLKVGNEPRLLCQGYIPFACAIAKVAACYRHPQRVSSEPQQRG